MNSNYNIFEIYVKNLFFLLGLFSLACPIYGGNGDSIPQNNTDSITPPSYNKVVLKTYEASSSLTYEQPVQLQSNGIVRNSDISTNISVDTNAGVGEIPLKSGTTQYGSKTYEIPIDLYPGMNGFQPSISLYYDSMQGTSPIGLGWDITGISRISRMGKTIYYDGETEGILNNYRDSFVLDGTRLMKMDSGISDGYISFQSEQGNIKAKGYVEGDDIKYFEVFYPDGKKALFGNLTNGGNNLMYPISSCVDLFGNAIEYEYIVDSNFSYISRITYNGTSVEFKYSTSNIKPFAYFGGTKVQYSKNLTSITCRTEAEGIKCTYSLSYTSYYGASVLTSIGYRSNSEKLNPLKFYYGDGSSIGTYNTLKSSLVEYYTAELPANIKAIRGKFDYYSKSDGIITLPRHNPYVRYHKDGSLFQHTKNYFNNNYNYNPSTPVLIYTDINETFASTFKGFEIGQDFIDILIADIHGKQHESIIKVNNYVSDNKDKIDFHIYKSNSWGGLTEYKTTTFDFNTVYIDNSKNQSIQPKFYYTGDFTGNGKTEILAVSAHSPFGEQEHPSICYIFDLDSEQLIHDVHVFPFNIYFPLDGSDTNPENYPESDKLFIVDYNGDGKSDLCHISDDGMSIYTMRQTSEGWKFELISNHPQYTKSTIKNKYFIQGDINGDRLTDFAMSSEKTQGGSTSWRLLYSKGNGDFDEVYCTGPLVTGSISRNYVLQDINGDGKTEMIKFGTETTDTYIMEGENFVHKATIQTPSSDAIFIPINNSSTNSFATIAILDKHELIQYSYTRNHIKDNILTGAVSSLGIVEKNEYGFINYGGIQTGLYASGSNATFPYVNIVEPLSVLSKSETFHSGKSICENSFKYSNAVFHRQGKGFCGFEKITSSDNRDNTTISIYDPYNYGVPISVVSPSQETHTEYSVETNSTGIKQILLKSQINKNLLNGFSYTSTFTYDKYGFPLTETEKHSDGITVQRELTYGDNQDDADNYSIGFVTDVRITTTRGADVYEEREYIPEHISRQPIVSIKYTNGNQMNRTEYSYDNFGNVLYKTVRSNGSSKGLYYTYTYNDRGLLASETDPFNCSINFSYDSYWRVTGIHDHTGIKRISYDSFGREARVINTDKTEINTSYNWNTTDNGGLYSIVTSETGKPIVTKYYDVFNHEVRSEEIRFDGSIIKMDKTYDEKGNVTAESLPYKEGFPEHWTIYDYDSFDRLTSRTEPTNKHINYSYNGASVIEDDGRTVKTRKYDSTNNLISVIDSEGVINNVLAADGQISRVDLISGSNSSLIHTSYCYDGRRRLVSINDPSFGISYKTYDENGNIASETDANGKTVTYEYDQYNRLVKRIFPEFETIYTYDGSNRVVSQVSTNGTSKTYTYDELGRVISEKESSSNSNWLQKDHTYSEGNVASTTYTSNYGTLTTENYTYTNGQLTDVYLTDGTLVYHLEEEDSFGHPTIVQTGDLIREYSYDEYGLPDGRIVNSQKKCYQDDVYYIQPHTSNLTARTDNIYGSEDIFDYDNQDRLTKYNGETIEYNSNGNILGRSDVGGYRYSTSKPYALNGFMACDDSEQVIQNDQEIEYTSFSRPSRISENNFTASFEYNADRDRTRMSIEKGDNRNSLTRHYLGGCYECDQVGVMAGNQVEKLYLMGNYYTSPSVLIRTSSTTKFDNDTIGTEVSDSIGMGIIKPFDPIGPYNPLGITDASEVMPNFFSSGKPYVSGVHQILRDYLGSIKHVIQPDGTEVETLDYDAWGRIILPNQNGRLQTVSDPPLYLGRGYTGHEDLHYFGLINMNARLYDPLLGRFLSPDPELQDPENIQNYNKYTYALNNPFKYNDPNGEFVIGIGSVLSCVTDLIINIFTRGVNFHNYNWGRTRNAWKIDAAMFAGSFFQILNKWSPWNFNNSMLGKAVSQFCNFFGMVDNVTILDGMAAVGGVTSGNKAFTIGHYSIGPKGYTATWKDHLFVHEYGHYMQSQFMGPFYLGTVGIPSLISASGDAVHHGIYHRDRWFEKDANKRAAKHFKRKYGYGIGENYFDVDAFSTNKSSAYLNPRTKGYNQDFNPIHVSGSRHSWWEFVFFYL